MSAVKSYAQALFEISPGATAQHALAATIQVARNVSVLVLENKEFKVLLESPSFSTKEKAEALGAILSKMGSAPLASKWITLIAEKGRASFLDEIANELEKIVAESEGKLVGDVISSEKIEETELKSLAQSFEKKMGKPVFLRQEKDENLLAGLKVTIGGLTYDGTLRTQLDRLKERFVEYKTKGMN
ncbi:MAG: ATP synthase F1 subunit delta [Xanthomonadaceae bacterium]|nr:ATP synthase F1 subunit delta [Xanthomonadaceae bacterium]